MSESDKSLFNSLTVKKVVYVYVPVFIVAFIFFYSIPVTFSTGSSMQPTFSQCEIHVYNPVVNEDQLQEGTIVFFNSPDNVNVVHRIVDIEDPYTEDSKYDSKPTENKLTVTETSSGGTITTTYYNNELNTSSSELYGDRVYITKGDNNPVIDPYITQKKDITGVSLYSYDAPDWTCNRPI